MPGTAVGLFLVDFIIRPFAKIFEKMPIVMLILLLLLYGLVGFFILRSAYMSEDSNPY